MLVFLFSKERNEFFNYNHLKTKSLIGSYRINKINGIRGDSTKGGICLATVILFPKNFKIIYTTSF